MEQLRTRRQRKRHGIHYTPQRLADYLARQTWKCHCQDQRNGSTTLRILDPACGDGRLLYSLASAIGDSSELEIVGFETDALAASNSKSLLQSAFQCDVAIHNQDFLACDKYFDLAFDIVITNPPYVRTQSLGQRKAQRLAKRFELTGRVDLYHAFVAAATKQIRAGGTLGLLTSNRFMYVQSGATIRKLLLKNFCLQSIYDLGDTRLFKAAVLPVVVLGRRTEEENNRNNFSKTAQDCSFVRIYESAHSHACQEIEENDLFSSLESFDKPVVIRSGGSTYQIETGCLSVGDKPESPWSLRNQMTIQFHDKISRYQACTFGDVAEIKVGIKTTADSVFIRNDWENLPQEMIPESSLLKPLITHHVAQRWLAKQPERQVLYPYQVTDKRKVVELSSFPNAHNYLLSHRERLSSRKYIEAANRQWFEVWVPQQPADWAHPKIVWPDIAESPRFFLDRSGAVVNGDCYWIKLRPDVEPDWLYLMLAVANSQIAIQFYDYQCQNKLYAGRRRFMTQYVKQFPLPKLDSDVSRAIVRKVKAALGETGCPTGPDLDNPKFETMVGKLFGY